MLENCVFCLTSTEKELYTFNIKGAPLMKKSNFVLFGLAVGVAFVALPGCTPSEQPYNILISNPKTEFVIGEEFSFGENMEVELVFENQTRMTLEDIFEYDFVHDEENKIYKGRNYLVDYSHFDSSKAGQYPIFIEFIDQDDDPDNNLRSMYTVNVPYLFNSFITEPEIQSSWDWLQTPVFTAPVLSHSASVKYEYRVKGIQTYTPIVGNDIAQDLQKLSAGVYELKTTVLDGNVYKGMTRVQEFTINRIDLPSGVESALQDIQKTYNGKTADFVIPESKYYKVDYSNSASWMNVGEHDVNIVLLDTNYKWAGTDSLTKTIKLNVLPAVNSWTNTNFEIREDDGVRGWRVGQYTPNFLILPEVKYGEVSYQIKLAGQDDSFYYDISLSELGNLYTGDFVLKAFVKNSDNYSNVDPITAEFSVLPPQ